MAEHRNHNTNPNQSVTVIPRIMERFGMGGSLRPIQGHPCYGQRTLHYPRMLRDLSNVARVGRETAGDEIRGLEEVSAPGRAKPDKADTGERRDRWIDGSISRDGLGGSQDVEGHGAALP